MIPSDAQRRRLESDGFLVLDPFLTEEEMTALEGAVDAEGAAGRDPLPRNPEFARDEDVVLFASVAERRPEICRVCCRGRLAGLAVEILGEARMHCSQLIVKPPGSAFEFYWHQDDAYTTVEPGRGITCWLALSTATEETGCLWFLPGSHRGGLQAHELVDSRYVGYRGPARGVPAVLARGGLVVFSSLVFHRTGGNATARPRSALVVEYVSAAARDRDTRRTFTGGVLIRRRDIEGPG